MAAPHTKLRRVLSRATLKKSKSAATLKPSTTISPTPTDGGDAKPTAGSDNTVNTDDSVAGAGRDPIAASLRRSGRTRADSIKTLFKSKSTASLTPSTPSTVDSDADPDTASSGQTSDTATTQASRQAGIAARDHVYPQSSGRYASDMPRQRREDSADTMKPKTRPSMEKFDSINEPESKETAQQRSQDGPRTDPGGRKAATSVSVADRILGYERRGTLSVLPKPVKRHRHSKAVYDEDAAEDSSGKEKESLPIVFPLHIRKFQRRDSKAAAMIQKPDTPFYRSEPDNDPTIHSPAPQRTIPALKTPPGTPPPVEAALSVAKTALQQANAQASVAKTALEQANKPADRPTEAKPEPATLSSQTAELKRPKSGKVAERQREIESLAAKNAIIGPAERSYTLPKAKDSQTAIPTSRVNPFAHFHGTRGYCVRHGRKSGQGSPKGARSTKDMYERGRNDDTPSSADACPDCVAELNIKRKELVDLGGFGRESLAGKDFHERKDNGDQPAKPANQAAAPVIQEYLDPAMQHQQEAAPKAIVNDAAQIVEKNLRKQEGEGDQQTVKPGDQSTAPVTQEPLEPTIQRRAEASKEGVKDAAYTVKENDREHNTAPDPADQAAVPIAQDSSKSITQHQQETSKEVVKDAAYTVKENDREHNTAPDPADQAAVPIAQDSSKSIMQHQQEAFKAVDHDPAVAPAFQDLSKPTTQHQDEAPKAVVQDSAVIPAFQDSPKTSTQHQGEALKAVVHDSAATPVAQNSPKPTTQHQDEAPKAVVQDPAVIPAFQDSPKTSTQHQGDAPKAVVRDSAATPVAQNSPKPTTQHQDEAPKAIVQDPAVIPAFQDAPMTSTQHQGEALKAVIHDSAATPVAPNSPKPTTQRKDGAPKVAAQDPASSVENGKSEIKHMGQIANEAGLATSKEPLNSQSGVSDSRPGRHLSWNSTDVEPALSTHRSTSSGHPSPTQTIASSPSSGNAAAGTNVAPISDHQPRAVHFRALSSSRGQETNEDHDIVVQRDLGDGLDAMILERGGRLERVVMNSRKGGPTAEVMARLARELSQVSSAISTTSPSHRDEREFTDGSFDEIIARRKSVPELEHLLRDAADAQEVQTHASLHPQADGSAEHVSSRGFPEAEGLECPDDDEIEGLIQRTPSQIERITMRQSIEVEYRALKGYLDSAGATVDADHQHNPTEIRHRWPTSQQCRALSFSTSRRHEPDWNLGSRTSPIRAEGECERRRPYSPEPELATCTSPSASGLPTLPSHILRAQDMMTALRPEYSPPSPLLFTTSTAPSLSPSANSSPLPSPETTQAAPVALGKAHLESSNTGRTPTPMPPAMVPPQPLGSPSQVRADSQVIRQVMRMEKEKNRAVQEAAALERAARRERFVRESASE